MGSGIGTFTVRIGASQKGDAKGRSSVCGAKDSGQHLSAGLAGYLAGL